MREEPIRRAGTLVAAVLAVDGLAHLYWSTDLTWPAPDSRAPSFAVLGFPVPFTPGILLPLAATLFAAALLVGGRARLGRVHRFGGLLQAGTVAVPDVWSWEILKPLVMGELMTNVGFGSRAGVAAGVRDLFVHRERVTDQVIDQMWAPGTLRDNLRSEYLLERGLDWRSTQERLPRTAQPTLVVWGARDTVLPVAQAATFGRLLPDAKVSVLGGCGHALTLDCPDQVTGLMEDFLGVR